MRQPSQSSIYTAVGPKHHPSPSVFACLTCRMRGHLAINETGAPLTPPIRSFPVLGEPGLQVQQIRVLPPQAGDVGAVALLPKPLEHQAEPLDRLQQQPTHEAWCNRHSVASLLFPDRGRLGLAQLVARKVDGTKTEQIYIRSTPKAYLLAKEGVGRVWTSN